MKNSRKYTMVTTTVRNIKLFILFTLVLIISGCASSRYAVQIDEIPSLSENKSRICFYRTSLLFGSGMKPAIYLNGEKVGFSISGTAFYVDVDHGKYKVSVDKIMYPGSKGGVDIEVQENEVVYVRTWTGGSSFVGRTNAGVVSPEKAEEHINKLKILRFDFGD